MIAVAFALEFESAYFRARHDQRLRVAIWLLGNMGLAAAQGLERQIRESKPKLIISAGFAGGLQPGLAVGDLVLGQNFTTPEIKQKLRLSESWKTGDLVTVDAVMEQGAEKAALGERTGAMVVDMETQHLAAVCHQHDIPMVSLRCISDAMNDNMPVPANTLLDPKTGRPQPLKLFQYLVTNPGSVPGFNRLVANARTAQARLAAGLEEVLPQVLQMT